MTKIEKAYKQIMDLKTLSLHIGQQINKMADNMINAEKISETDKCFVSMMVAISYKSVNMHAIKEMAKKNPTLLASITIMEKEFEALINEELNEIMLDVRNDIKTNDPHLGTKFSCH